MKYVLGLIGLALLIGSPLPGQAPAAVAADQATCQACESGCGAQCGCNSGCGCNSCCKCCPYCGCRLVPTCHVYCEPKKVTDYKHCFNCKDICIPPLTPLCCKCGCCDTCNNGCRDGCGCHCTVREVKKLVKCPCTKEVPVRKCCVEWVCPHCSACPDAGPTPAPQAAPAAPAPKAPLPPTPVR